MHPEDHPAGEADDTEPVPAGPLTANGLPRRVRQANLSPLLRGKPIGRPADDEAPSIEALQVVHSALQRDFGPAAAPEDARTTGTTVGDDPADHDRAGSV